MSADCREPLDGAKRYLPQCQITFELTVESFNVSRAVRNPALKDSVFFVHDKVVGFTAKRVVPRMALRLRLFEFKETKAYFY